MSEFKDFRSRLIIPKGLNLTSINGLVVFNIRGPGNIILERAVYIYNEDERAPWTLMCHLPLGMTYQDMLTQVQKGIKYYESFRSEQETT